MNTIGAIGYERQPETRQETPRKGPFDRARSRHRDRDRDGEPAHDAPGLDAPGLDGPNLDAPGRGTKSAHNVAGRLHKLNVTA